MLWHLCLTWDMTRRLSTCLLCAGSAPHPMAGTGSLASATRDRHCQACSEAVHASVQAESEQFVYPEGIRFRCMLLHAMFFAVPPRIACM